MSGQPCEHKGRLVGLIPQTKYLRIRSVPVVYVLREDYCSLGKCSKGLFSLARRFSIEYEKNHHCFTRHTYCTIIELGNRKIVCNVHLEVHGILMYWKGPRTNRTIERSKFK